MKNITFVEGRTLTLNERIDVYFNLHKGNFSIRSCDKRNPHYNKVVAYAPSVSLTECEFKVSNAGVLEIRRDKRKSVCAFIRGYFQGVDGNVQVKDEVYFNPYTTDTFINVKKNTTITSAAEVFCIDKQCWALEELTIC